MDQDRQETYERIPWETLQQPKSDKQWIVISVAGAVAVGALAYSFVRNQPPTQPPVVAPATVAAVSPATIPPPLPAPTSAIVVTEADLFAVDPERVIDQVAAHAEWFAVEYFSADGSDESKATLIRLLPEGVPAPVVPEGTQVFVDWVGVLSVSERLPLTYEVEVAVRSMVSGGDGVFTRQPTRVATFDIALGPDGLPRVASPPSLAIATTPSRHQLGIDAVPSQVAELFMGYGEVVGGYQLADGRWEVVVMTVGSDGVTRPTLMTGP